MHHNVTNLRRGGGEERGASRSLFFLCFQIDTKQLKSLPGMVTMSLSDFTKEWQELAHEVTQPGSEWDNLRYADGSIKNERYGEEALDAGSRHRVSVGFTVQTKVAPRILFTGTGGKKSDLSTADWQKRLCQVLVNGEAFLWVT